MDTAFLRAGDLSGRSGSGGGRRRKEGDDLQRGDRRSGMRGAARRGRRAGSTGEEGTREDAATGMGIWRESDERHGFGKEDGGLKVTREARGAGRFAAEMTDLRPNPARIPRTLINI